MMYFLEANLAIALFYLVYKTGLSRSTFFQFNRGFLIIGIGVSLTLPFLELPVSGSSGMQSAQLPAFVVEGVAGPVQSERIFTQPLLMIYYSGVLFFAVALLFGFCRLLLLIKNGTYKTISGIRVLQVPAKNLQFTFMNFIVLSEDTPQHLLPVVIEHEKVHQRQWHSVDLLIAEVLRIAFWFNPVTWLYKKELAQNHEYIADTMTKNADGFNKDYTNWLYAGLLGSHQPVLANHFFNKSLIKNRLTMLHKKPSGIKSIVSYSILIPLLFMGLYLVSCAEGSFSPGSSEETVHRKKVESITYSIPKDALLEEFDAYFASEYSKKNHEVIICNDSDERYEITYTEFAETK